MQEDDGAVVADAEDGPHVAAHAEDVAGLEGLDIARPGAPALVSKGLGHLDGTHHVAVAQVVGGALSVHHVVDGPANISGAVHTGVVVLVPAVVRIVAVRGVGTVLVGVVGVLLLEEVDPALGQADGHGLVGGVHVLPVPGAAVDVQRGAHRFQGGGQEVANANLLSGELATLLSGRYVEIKIYPLSFKEFLHAKNVDSQSRLVDKLYSEYEKYGGFPSVVMADEPLKETILSGIFDSIVLNDIAHRAGVKDTHILKSVILFLADNVGQLVNPSKISNTLTSERVPTSNHTISKYLELLENAFLFYKAKQYDIRGKGYLKTNAKYFIVDNGLRRHAIGKKGANYANRLENIVFIELLRRGYTVDVGKLDSKEIDFIARKADEILYVQVAFEIPENTHETDNLLHIKDNYKKILITGKYYEQTEIDGIEVIYVVDWLLQ